MLILVFSESHSHTSPMCGAVLKHHPDVVLHLGDNVSDMEKIRELAPNIRYWGVKGNCDLGSIGIPDQEELVLGGIRIFMTHGHLYRVKYDTLELINAGLQYGAECVLFGHTHVPCWNKIEGMTVLNPGSVGYGGTYALLEAEAGNLSFSIKRWEEQ